MKRTTPSYDQRDIDAGINAERLLGDETFQTAIHRARESIVSRWIVASTRQEREELHAQVVALPLVVIELGAAVGDGKQAQHLKKLQEKRESTSTSEGE